MSLEPGGGLGAAGPASSSPDAGASAEAALWRHLAEAATVEAYLGAWLALQCRRLRGSVSASVLLGPPDTGPFAPAAGWPAGAPPSPSLSAAAQTALQERRSCVRRTDPPARGVVAARETFALAQPLLLAGALHGAVVVELSARPEADLAAALRELAWGSAWLEGLVQRSEASREAARRSRLRTAFELLASALEHDRFQAAATAFATEAATLLGCDRVSTGFVRRRRVHVCAISHSAHFAKRANLVRALEAAMDECLEAGVAVLFPPTAGDGSSVGRAHEELARQYGAGGVLSVPLVRGEDVCGVLTLERPPGSAFDAETVALCETTAVLAGPLLELARREDRWIGAKALASLWTLVERIAGPRHTALKLGTLAAAGLALFLVFARGDFRVTAKVVLEAKELRAAAAPFDGFVAAGNARAGDLVVAGQPLGRLDDRELRLERMKWASQLEQALTQYREALAAREAAKSVILSAQIDQARAQLALLEDQLGRTELRAPVAGVVVSGDLSQRLGAPVERGSVLFEVAPLDAWRVVLQVDE
ncbi:MAG: GAF domain-containing protein, partial [Deltaproteobacteria bacterium]|nr:GAF domain-containing protein [Deltaproteobacteria bacterium]